MLCPSAFASGADLLLVKQCLPRTSEVILYAANPSPALTEIEVTVEYGEPATALKHHAGALHCPSVSWTFDRESPARLASRACGGFRPLRRTGDGGDAMVLITGLLHG